MIFKKSIPLKDKVAAISQWFVVGISLGVAVVLGWFMSLLAALTSKKTSNFLGEIWGLHSDKYIKLGSSGKWEYMASTFPFIKLWSNYEDGDLGEPNGKQSARVKGKERSFWNRYYWLAFRNPFNYGKRTIPFFHCMVDNCVITYYGDYFISDKYFGKDGWQFVKAVDKFSGRVYYGYWGVKTLRGNKVRQTRVGFKIKPSHADYPQALDDKDKAFTVRYQHRSVRN